MNVEFWNSFFQWGSVVLVAVTFFLGAGALWTGNRINERQTNRLVVLETELAKANTVLAEQQTRAAIAEKGLLELQQSIQRDKQPRYLNSILLVDALKGKRTAKAEVWFQPDDFEAYGLASQISTALRLSGWELLTPNPEPIPSDAVKGDLRSSSPEFLKRTPLLARIGAQPRGVSLTTKDVPSSLIQSDNEPAVVSLLFALTRLLGGSGAGIDSSIPAGTIRVIVGPKP